MTQVYCGVDFHARRQTICYCNTADGEIHCQEPGHQKDDLRTFYAQFTGDVVVGLEEERLQHLVLRVDRGTGAPSLVR